MDMQQIIDRIRELQVQLDLCRERARYLEDERDTLRDTLVTCRIRCERAEKALATMQRKETGR
jgi:hypothetical protein